MAAPLELKATPYTDPPGKVAGFAYLVPKPEPDHGYVLMVGEPVKLPKAIADPSGLKATSKPVPPASVDGFVYLVPKPEPLQG
jgi:hypothetical protein